MAWCPLPIGSIRCCPPLYGGRPHYAPHMTTSSLAPIRHLSPSHSKVSCTWRAHTIADSAFASLPAVYLVIISDGVERIGRNAFCDCKDLLEVRIPSSVRTIGAGAFWNCTQLRAIAVPNGVEAIKDFTFRNCTSLVSVSLGTGVKAIGAGAFSGCRSLLPLAVAEDVAVSEYAFEYGYAVHDEGTGLEQTQEDTEPGEGNEGMADIVDEHIKEQ